MTMTRRVRDKKRGVLTLELALILPFLLFALLALVEISTYLMAVQSIQGAAMVGAREATLPNATPDRVRAAVTGALAGWSYAGALGPNDIQIVDTPVDGTVSVTVTVDADKAALNPLSTLPLFNLSGKKIGAKFIMRKE
jgi:Flp pilus assembly protein TadG